MELLHLKQTRLEDTIVKKALNDCKRAFTYAFIFSFFINIMMLAMPIYSLQVLDRVLSSFSVETLIVLSFIVIAILIFMSALQIMRSFVFAQIGIWLEKKLQPLLIDKTIDNSVYNSSIGSQYVRDLNNIKSFIANPALTMLFDAPWSIIYFAVIFLIHPVNGFIVTGGATILFVMAYINEKMANEKLKKINEREIDFLNKVGNLTHNSESLIAMGMKEDIVNKMSKISDENSDLSYGIKGISFLIGNLTKLIRMIIQIATMFAGAILVINNKMSAGGIIATSILAGKALAPFDALVNIWGQLVNAKKSYGRITNALENLNEEHQKTELPEPKGKVKVEKLTYKLPNGKQIIKGINIDVKPGEVVAIIGPSGSGKTTFAKLLVGILKPSSGRVAIDGTKIADYNQYFLGKYIGYLPQHVEFINGTVRENIARMSPKIDDKQVINAAHLADSHELIAELEKGYNTIVETGGKTLSAGQKQRIGLARCFYGNPKIMVLDEPNSNLDTKGEVSLTNAIKNAKKQGITTFIISHRTRILNTVDKVLVVHGGQGKLFGPTKEVLAKLNEGNN